MKRDFVSVDDVVAATRRALYYPKRENIVCNVGGGEIITILDAAKLISRLLGKRAKLAVSGHFREGDIRHCYADLSNAFKILGYVPRVRFREGVKSYIPWVLDQLCLRTSALETAR